MTTPESSAPTRRDVNPADAARTELYHTLGQLRSRLDYAQRIDNGLSDARRRMVQQRLQHPARFAAGVGGVALLAGLAVYKVAQAVIRTLD